MKTGRRSGLASVAALAALWAPAAFADTTAPQPAAVSPVARFFVLYDLGERPKDPIWQLPGSAIAVGADGDLYTTSTGGGAKGYGTVFKFSPTDGKPPTVLYDFDFVHGAGPQGGLTRGRDGNFYGTTYQGGKYGVGTIFSVTPTGALSVLWDFRNGLVVPPPVGRLPTEKEKLDAAASYPVSAPVALGDAWYGVSSYADNQPWGVVYTIGGGYSGLYRFKAADVAANGNYPVGLSVGPGGSLWGTTLKGGLGWGTVFQVVGGGVATIHKFDAASAGSLGVIQGADGYLYGTSVGPNTSFGLVYRLNPLSQEFQVIHCFVGDDGAGPVAGVMQASDGMLYGVTKYGGRAGRGVIYRLNPKPSDNHCTNPREHPSQDPGDYAVLFHFDMNDGRYAMSPLVESSKPGSTAKDFYGVTYQGGTHDAGVVYRVNVHLYPTPARQSYYAGGALALGDGTIAIQKNVNAFQRDDDGTSHLKETDGVSVTLACLRDPHIVQFVYREKIDVESGGYVSGPYDTTWGKGFELTTNPADPKWHTDAIGAPNAYYDQAPGASHQVEVNLATVFDKPNMAYDAVLAARRALPVGAPDDARIRELLAAVPFYERVTALDFGICNGKVIRTATWTRSAHWNAARGEPDPAALSDFKIEAPTGADTDSAWSNAKLQWINDHLNASPATDRDGRKLHYDPVP